jgi:tripartite-type tricarboxylate transporter receptor subunit TctC
MRPRVQQAPGIPCALSFLGERLWKTSGASRREIAEVHSVGTTTSLRAQRSNPLSPRIRIDGLLRFARNDGCWLRNNRVAICLLAIGVAAIASIGGASALDYPTRPVRWVVGFAPGGSNDIIARLIGQRLSERLGQQFVIENKPGAGGNIGAESVINAEPDGYTVLLVNPSNYINTSLYANLKFNFPRDVAAVASFMRVPNVMTVNGNVEAKTVAEFIAYAKANPGKVNMASAGNGTSVHLSGEMFMAMADVKLQHVPYRGSGPAINDLLGGQVQVMFDSMPSIIQHIRAGTLRALAVTSATRSSQLPDTPTVGETVPGYEASALFGMAAPRNTPKEIIDRLNQEINAVLAEPDMKKRLVELGGDPLIGTPEAFGAMIVTETEKWKKVIEGADIKKVD